MVRFYHDSRGVPRIETKLDQRSLGAFLEGDIQRSESVYQMFKKGLDEAKRMKSGWSLTGNSHKVTIANDQVRIENLWSDEPGPTELPVAEFKRVLEEWRQFAWASK